MKLLPTESRARMALVGVVIVLAHATSFARPLLDSDEAVYASIAALVNAGGRLYAEGGVDNKFPGIYFTYAALFELFGRYAMQAVHAFALGVVLLTAVLLGQIAKRIAGERASLLAALFYGLLTTFYYPKMLAANTEVFMMLPLAGSVLLSLPDSNGRSARFPALLAAGALIGLATMYRQLAGLNVALSCLAPLLARDVAWPTRLLRAVCPAAGFVAAFAALAGLFVVQGNLHEFWFWTVGVTSTRYLPSGWTRRWPWEKLLSVNAVYVAPWLLTALRARRFSRSTSAERLVWIWLPLGLVAIFVLFRFHPHYILHVSGPLSVLSALEVDQRLSSLAPMGRRRLVALTSVGFGLPALVTAVLSLLLDPISGGFESKRPDYPAVARYIAENTSAEERVFVWGAYSTLYVLSNRLPASRFVGFLRGCSRSSDSRPEACWDSGPETWPLLREDLRKHPPALIVDTSSATHAGFNNFKLQSVPVLRELLGESYRFDREIAGIAIYRRRGDPRD